MRLRLIYLEFKKLITSPLVIALVLLSLMINLSFMYFTRVPYPSSDTSPSNIFTNFKAQTIAESYIAKYDLSGRAAQNIRAKYARLQPVIEQKARDQDALSTYFGGRSYYYHKLLFGEMFQILLAQSGILSMVLALLSVSYESLSGTEGLFYATKTGRHLVRSKLWASMGSALLISSLLFCFTLLTFFSRFDYRSVWQSNVSSSLNYAVAEFGKPFITWQSYSLKAYFLTCLLIASGFVLSLSCLSYGITLSIRNSYVAGMSLLGMMAFPYLLRPLFTIGSLTRNLLNLSPYGLWQHGPAWCTDGHAEIIWPHFERIGVAGLLAIGVGLAISATKRFRRREFL